MEEAKTTTSEPVTVLEGRTLEPGHESDYHDWVHRTIAASERFPGNQGITDLTPDAGQPGGHYLALSFANEAAKQVWQWSEDWTRLRQEAAGFLDPPSSKCYAA
jgi:antibiotic biosynthesis monooxygenase (ABM) superfamily enzyme